MTFEAILEAGTLQDYLDTLTALVDESVIEFRESVIYSQAIDPANVAMGEGQIHAAACESYTSDGLRVGVNLSRFVDYLDKASSDDLVHLSYDGETRRIDIEYGDVSVSMACIDPDSVRDGDSLPEDAIDSMAADLRMDGAAFKHATEVAGMVSDHIRLDSDPDREDPFHVIGQGDTDDAAVEFSSALHGGSDIAEPCTSLFSEEYIEAIVGVIPKQAEIRLQHGDEWPLRITYEFPDAAVDIEFGLAPRIQSE